MDEPITTQETPEGAAPETETPEAGQTPEGQAPESQEPNELDALAAEAEQLGKPDISAPGASGEEEEAPALTDSQKLDWVVNQIYNMQQQNAQQGNQQQQPAEQESTNPGMQDLYNGAFETPEQQQQNSQLPTLEQFHALEQTVTNLQNTLNSVNENQASLQQSVEQRSQADERSAKVAEIQKDYKLTPEDAEFTMRFMESGDYAKGLKFARGRSQFDGANTDAMQQRAEDRDLSGRPSVPGGTQQQPASNQNLLESKMAEYREETDVAKRDELGMWLLENGGAELLRQDAMQVVRNIPQPNDNLNNELRSEFANTDGIV